MNPCNRGVYAITYILVIISALTPFGYSETVNSFLLLEDPFEVRIYNKYEQNLTKRDSLFFLRYSPIEIITADQLLSDNYTSCFTGKIENQIYFFIKTEKEAPLSKNFTKYAKQFKNVSTFFDTLEVIKHNAILYIHPEKNTERYFLPSGTKLFRVFETNSKTYIKTLDQPQKYGWTKLSDRSAWRILRLKNSKIKHDVSDIEKIVQTKITEVNHIIKKLFIHFNTLNNSQLEFPYWEMITEKEKIICNFINNEYGNNYTESTSLLINRLQLSLSHTEYSVSDQSGSIIINKK